ncbi:solute carrier family 22 member 3 isoform X1 [Halyomorpha halys]|uniref:solute carrier family 22 member 3 isoform X1 n=2 Tax=Halyomorpha halys TaxID=286706 RepID=UPI0006D4F09C|nr:solute carrier family 22 member 3-like isoform X1 [Halyomorpha halys]XP_014272464.1 solute carrier family 22 member 3-like isoform X1 [Halyomorpha halys]XP_014272472.1 solute carrier family 22 member 3-like isoform X1 [Halyomorpha halys]
MSKTVEAEVQATVPTKNAETQFGNAFVRGGQILGRTVSSYQATEEDPLTIVLGQFGRWQFLITLLLFFFNLPCVFQLMVSEFEGAFLGDFWCKRPDNLQNITVEKWKEISGVHKTTEESGYDPCHIKNLDYPNLDPDDASTWAIMGPDVDCKDWEYGHAKESIVSEWKLPCVKISPTSLAESLFAVGGCIGSVLTGYYIDKIGRRKLLLISQGVQAMVSFLTAITPWYWAYLVLRTIQGFVTTGNIFANVILCQEITGRNWMGLVGASYMYSYPLGYIIVAILAEHFEKWRHLHYAVTFLSITLLATWWVMPESPRWLWVQKDIHDLIHLLEDASHINGQQTLSHEVIHAIKTKGPMLVPDRILKVHLRDLYATPVMKKLSQTTPFLFFCTYFAYYGIVLRLNGMYTVDVYRTVLFTGIVEFTATSVCLGLSGRSWINTTTVIFCSSMSAGVLCLFINALPGMSDGIPYCLVFARFFMSMTNANLLTCVSELYPTKMRALGAGWANMYMNLGLLCTANAAKLVKIKEGMPVFLMGLSGMVSALLVLFLPAPLWYGIPDLVEQMETPYIILGR